MFRVYLLLVVVTLISGLTPIAAHMATSELPPLTLAPLRFGIAGLLLAVSRSALGLPWPDWRAHFKTFILLGAICVPVNQVCYLTGIKLANATHAGIAYALVPVMVFWMSIFIGTTQVNARMLMATTLASLGAGLVVLNSKSASASLMGTGSATLFIGDLLLLGAAGSWSLFAILSQPLVRQFGAIPTLATVFLIGSVLHTPLIVVDALWFGLKEFDWTSVTWRGAAGFTYITLLTAYLNYFLWYVIVARFDVTRSTVVTNSNFLVTVLVEAAVLGQSISAWVAAGSAALFTGIALAGTKTTSTIPPRPSETIEPAPSTSVMPKKSRAN